MSKSVRRKLPASPRQPQALPIPPRAMSEAELRQMMNEEISKRIQSPIDRAKPLGSDAQTGAANEPTVTRLPPATGSGLSVGMGSAGAAVTVEETPTTTIKPLPNAQPGSEKAIIPAVIAESSTTIKPRAGAFEPSGIEAALRRSPAFKEAPPSQAQIAEEAETNPAPEPQKNAIPKMTDGDLGLPTEKLAKPVIVREIHYRDIPAKTSSPFRHQLVDDLQTLAVYVPVLIFWPFYAGFAVVVFGLTAYELWPAFRPAADALAKWLLT
jgi:hypothetical protein